MVFKEILHQLLVFLLLRYFYILFHLFGAGESYTSQTAFIHLKHFATVFYHENLIEVQKRFGRECLGVLIRDSSYFMGFNRNRRLLFLSKLCGC